MKNNEEGFWDEKRINACIKLGLWAVFITVILIVFSLSNRNNPLKTDENEKDEVEVKEKFDTFDNMQDKLLKNSFDYTFTITSGATKTLFSGTKCNNVDSGYKETENGILKYVIEDGIIYKNNLGNMEVITNLYEGLKEEYLNIETLFKNLKSYIYHIEKENDKRTVTYKKEEYQVKVITNLENIETVEITDGDDTYILNFMSTSKCQNN